MVKHQETPTGKLVPVSNMHLHVQVFLFAVVIFLCNLRQWLLRYQQQHFCQCVASEFVHVKSRRLRDKYKRNVLSIVANFQPIPVEGTVLSFTSDHPLIRGGW